MTDDSKTGAKPPSTGLRDRAGELLPCRQCNYSAPPIESLFDERKHYHAHAYQCLRCGFQSETGGTWDEARVKWNIRALLACPAPAGAEGWVLVPREATREMAIAAHARDHDGTTSMYHKIWAAMIAAASPAPAPATPPAEAREIDPPPIEIPGNDEVMTRCWDEESGLWKWKLQPRAPTAPELVQLVQEARSRAKVFEDFKTSETRDTLLRIANALEALAALPAVPEVRG